MFKNTTTADKMLMVAIVVVSFMIVGVSIVGTSFILGSREEVSFETVQVQGTAEVQNMPLTKQEKIDILDSLQEGTESVTQEDRMEILRMLKADDAPDVPLSNI